MAEIAGCRGEAVAGKRGGMSTSINAGHILPTRA
jgi:hypothetical protein